MERSMIGVHTQLHIVPTLILLRAPCIRAQCIVQYCVAPLLPRGHQDIFSFLRHYLCDDDGTFESTNCVSSRLGLFVFQIPRWVARLARECVSVLFFSWLILKTPREYQVGTALRRFMHPEDRQSRDNEDRQGKIGEESVSNDDR